MPRVPASPGTLARLREVVADARSFAVYRELAVRVRDRARRQRDPATRDVELDTARHWAGLARETHARLLTHVEGDPP